MAEKYIARLQTPEVDGERQDVQLVTSSEAVICGDTMLNEKLDQMQIQLTQDKPAFACVWAKPLSTSYVDE